MTVKFLGTAAAEGLPAVFCNCETCRRAKARGGRDVRTRSQILIDGDTLFDFPMDTYMHMLTYRLDLSRVSRVLITHSHMDHCYPQEFCMRGGPFAHGMTSERVTVFCNRTVREMFLADTAREMRKEVADAIDVQTLSPFDTAYDGDMKITALPASHTRGEDCLVYYIRRKGAGALFLNDTGPIEKSVYERLAATGAKVGFVAMDCTYGAIRHGTGRHMGLYDCVEQAELMAEVGLLTADAKKYVTHFSHNTDLDYAGIVEKAAPYGISVAYDGCTVEI